MHGEGGEGLEIFMENLPDEKKEPGGAIFYDDDDDDKDRSPDEIREDPFKRHVPGPDTKIEKRPKKTTII